MSTPNQDSVYEKWKAGELEWHIDQGIIRTAVITYCNIYDTYKRLREEHKLTYLEAVDMTAEKMNTSPDTVRRAIAEVM